MCARFTLTARPQWIAELFDLDLLFDIAARYNVAPSQEVLAARAGPDGRREFARLRWGLIPSWANDASIGNKLLNARSETIGEKPAFRDAIRKRRCLIPADGFFEWQTKNRKKLPFYIHFPDRKPFAFAGIWDKWSADDGAIVETCSILTTSSNNALKPLHDRMPVILAKKDHEHWLDPNVTDVKDLQPLLHPLADDALVMEAVNPKVNNARFDDPVCIEPLATSTEPQQGRLWEE